VSDLARSKNFLALPPELSRREGAFAHIIPVPFDATSSWQKGADLGPQAIIDASAALEWHDIESGAAPAERGIHTTAPVTGAGDDPALLAPMVRARVGRALEAGAVPVVLGGEHSVSIGAIAEASERFDGLTVLQLDAHADTRTSYSGSAYSHACVMARARERASIVQVGIRSIGSEELSGLDASRVVWGHEIAAAELRGAEGRAKWIGRAAALAGDGPLYVTVDLDVFDPSVVPATGTPEPGGLDWWQVTGVLAAVAARSRIVGFDVVELCPRPGGHGSAFAAAKLVNRVLAMV